MEGEYGQFAIVYDRLMGDVDYTSWASRIKQLISERIGETENITVLDAACGTGNITIPLRKFGYHVTGADISEDMLRVAQEKSRQNGLQIPFVQMDIRNLALHRPVHVVNCSCDGVNYLLSDADVRAFLESAYSVLIEGGCLLFDISSPYKFQNILDGHCFGEDLEDIAYLWSNSLNGTRMQMDLAFFMRRSNGFFTRFRETHFQRMHFQENLQLVLDSIGFVHVQWFESWTNNLVTEKSERLLCVATKKNYKQLGRESYL